MKTARENRLFLALNIAKPDNKANETAVRIHTPSIIPFRLPDECL